MTDHTLLSVFTPSRTPPEDLETIHVQRREMLDDAVDRVRESATTGHKHHMLFVGARGTGKTHFVTLLVHHLGHDRALDERLRIAWLNEDETSTTLLELFRRIYVALIKRYPDEFTEASLETIYELAPDEAEQRLAQLLLDRLKDRSLLVVVENLDALFDGLGTPGQQKLRAFIQENPVLILVATAQRLVDDITKRTSAFFGFFQTEQLKTLSVEQATELLGKIAMLKRKPDVAAFIRSSTGHSRIRALHHLSGGNHRIYIVLSQFITRDSIDDLVGPFTKMIDEMTPYYQERIRWLPAQQRKIIEYLCSCERPTPVKEMARKLFASQQSISSQLKDLREKGYVQAAQRGRESLYEIAEPLMRICVEVKENQSYEPLRMLVDFLRVWYDGRELSARLEECDAGTLARAYLESAIEKNSEQGDLRAQLLVEGLRTELGDERSSRWSTRIESLAQKSEELALACGEWAKGDNVQALVLLDEIADENNRHSDSTRASAWMLAAEIRYEQGEYESAIKYLDMILAVSDIPAEQVAQALYNKGVTYGQLGALKKAIADYSAAIDLPQAPVEQVAQARINRGVTYKQLGALKKAIADYSAVIDLPQAPVEQVAQALTNRGVTYGQLGEQEKEITDYSAAIDLPQAPVEQVAQARINRGVTYKQLGEQEKAITDYSAAIDLPQAPVEQVAQARINRGVTYKQLGALKKAIADYCAVIDLPQAPVEQVAQARINRGVTYGQLGEQEKEITEYSAAIDLPQAPVEQVAQALTNRGVTYGQLGEQEKEIADYSAVIDLPQAPVKQVAQALTYRGLTYGQLGEQEKEIADYSAIIDLPQAPVKQVAQALTYRGLTYGQLGEQEKAIADYSAVIDLPQAPVKQVAQALTYRGLTYGQLGEREKAIADYSAVIDLPQAPVKQVAQALIFRSMEYTQLGALKKAIADCSTAIDLPQAPVKQVALGLFNRGILYWQAKEAENSLKDFKAVHQLDGAKISLRVDAYFALAEIHIGTGQWESAVAALADGLKGGNSHAPAYLGNSRDVIGAFFESAMIPKIRSMRARELARVYRDNNAITQLGEVLTEHLGSLYASDDNLPASDVLELWASAWEDAGKGIDEFRLPLRIFRTGIDFLKSGGKDRGILLNLNQEERNILEQALNLESEH